MDESPYREYGIYTRRSFILFAEKTGVPVPLADKILDESIKAIPAATEMIERSFLSTEAKKKYREIVDDRHRRFTMK